MNILSVDAISKTVADKDLLRDVSFGLNEGEKAGLIGINGSGKTTLLRLIANLDEPDSGRVARARNLKIAYLPQIPVFNPEVTVREHIYSSSNPRLVLIREYEKALETGKGDLDHLQHEMEKSRAWDFENEIKSVLFELDIRDLDMKMGNLSGGMARKVAMAQALIDDADLLILDEPTNHLDARTSQWLEEYLVESKKALILVTHDRYFLENITSRIFELDGGVLTQYEGAYSDFLERKAAIAETTQRTEQKASRLLKSELEWLRRQPKARGTKQKARIDRIDDLSSRKTSKTEKFQFSSSGTESKNRILELKNIGKSYGERTLFGGFNHTFRSGERLGVLGPNGCGKSTLFKIISGVIEPDTGTVVKGLHTRIGFFGQDASEMDGSAKVFDFVKKTAGELMEHDGKKVDSGRLLDYFGFTDRMQHTAISRLSGGERRRLQLVLLLALSPNFLILDEPTNDLDISTLGLLEEYLLQFGGCVLASSHDRYFLDRIAPALFVFEDEILKFEGTASEYLEQAGKRKKSAAKAEKQAKASAQVKKLSFKEVREFADLEKEIETLEKEKSRLEEILASGADYEKIREAGESFNTLSTRLKEKMDRWEELAQKQS